MCRTLLTLLLCLASISHAAERKPNVIIIYTDDQGSVDLNCYGSKDLATPNMDKLANELAGNLSGGQKKLLELGRTMMVEPKIVILDEVGAGVNRSLLKEIGDAILSMNRDRGYTFCMIEHDMDFISRLCAPVVVMAEGKILAEGSAEQIKSNEEVIEAYLGKGLKNKQK